MKIRTKLKLNTWISAGTVIIMITASACWLFYSSQTYRDSELIDELRRVAAERVMLRDDYLLHREERAKFQWQAKSESFRSLLDMADARFEDREDKVLLKEARKVFETTFASFSEFLDEHKRKEQAADKTLDFTDAESKLINQVFLKAYILSDNIAQLHENIRKKAKEAQERGVLIIALFIIGGVTAIISNTKFIGNLLDRKIATLTSGVDLIGKGNLGYRIEETGDDELSILARASNEMADRLKKSHTSVENLRQEIAERQRAEDRIHRQGELLMAINSVFLEALTITNKEAVAQTCLRVAQELTGSKFGFIGEITPENLFTTTALSNPGWEACRIPETQANVMIKNMVIRGIWGQVLLKNQSLIVNDPVSYPDRVGIPEGHPPLTSFLGVPLKDQDRVIGMIAVANRDSGYTADDQQDLEALSIAFTEAIQRHKAEEKIRQLNAELEQRVIERTTQLEAVNKELEAFSYSVSHDLRAPLRSIDGFSLALLEDYQKKLDATGRNYLDKVRKATQHMSNLIEDMLKLSRVTRSEFHQEAIDLSKMVQSISDTFQKNNPNNKVKTTIQKGIVIQGDPHSMQIALTNLIDNAWKFTGKQKHPRIEFGATLKDNEKIFFIRDNGVGFDMSYVGKLFGAFQRLHTMDEFAGTGIGLATVQRIINRHGGKIWAEGEVGKGATFYFTLPS